MGGVRSPKWRLLTTGFLNAFENMAIDDAILKTCSQGQSPPTVRFYGWTPHALSLGYSQQIKDTVDLKACDRLCVDIVRRTTGGRAVLHDEELTYSLISPSDNLLFPMNILESYRRISSCLIVGFKRLHINAQPLNSKERRRVLPGKRPKPSCFSSPSWYEITVGGKKICGSAQRRVGGAFLQHGSILLRFDAQKLYETLIFRGLEREVIMDYLERNITSVSDHLGNDIEFYKVQEAFIAGFEQGLEIELEEVSLSPQEEELKEQYLKQRYLNLDWNLKTQGNPPERHL